MNSNFLISVIIPTYNHAHLISKCLQSVINQTHQNLEIIVINNYSTDDTINIVKSFNDKRIKLINFYNKGFIGVARNVGLNASRGEYIAFLDSDDSWYPDKLEKSLNAMLEDSVDVFCHHMQVIQQGKISFKKYSGPLENSSFENLLFRGNCIILSASVISRKVLQKLSGFTDNEAMITSDDYDLWIRAAKAGLKFKFLNEVLGEYLVHNSNTTSKSAERFYNSSKSTLLYHYQFVQNNFLNKVKLRKSISLLQYAAGRSLQNSSKKVHALKFYIESIITYPFNLKLYFILIIFPLDNFITKKLFEKTLLFVRKIYFEAIQFRNKNVVTHENHKRK